MAALAGLRLVAFLTLLVVASMVTSYRDVGGRIEEEEEEADVNWARDDYDDVERKQDMDHDKEDSESVDYGNEYHTRLQDEDYEVHEELEDHHREKRAWWGRRRRTRRRRSTSGTTTDSTDDSPGSLSSGPCMHVIMRSAGISEDKWTGYEHELAANGENAEELNDLSAGTLKIIMQSTLDDAVKLRTCLNECSMPCPDGSTCVPGATNFTCG